MKIQGAANQMPEFWKAIRKSKTILTGLFFVLFESVYNAVCVITFCIWHQEDDGHLCARFSKMAVLSSPPSVRSEWPPPHLIWAFATSSCGDIWRRKCSEVGHIIWKNWRCEFGRKSLQYPLRCAEEQPRTSDIAFNSVSLQMATIFLMPSSKSDHTNGIVYWFE